MPSRSTGCEELLSREEILIGAMAGALMDMLQLKPKARFALIQTVITRLENLDALAATTPIHASAGALAQAVEMRGALVAAKKLAPFVRA